MKKLFIIFFASILFHSLFAQKYTVSGGLGQPYTYKANLNDSGLEAVYLLNTLKNAKFTYSSSAISVKFYRYKNNSGDKDEITEFEIPPYSSGGVTTYTITNLQDNHGFFVEENGVTKNGIWIIDYSIHQATSSTIDIIENDDKCKNLKLIIRSTDELFFYTTKGVKRNIPRKYTITYDNKKWDGTNYKFIDETITLSNKEANADIIISAPLRNTQFKLKGEEFNIVNNSIPVSYNAIAVKAYIEKKNELNEEIPKDESLSAPYTVNFFGHANEPITSYYTWFIYNQNDMNNPVARYNDRDLKNYTFEQAGNYVIELEAANHMSSCPDTARVTLNILVSDLKIPNYFSPDDSPGVNDEFKVYYKSLIKFKCTIFNRWGVKLYEWTDPSKGWDGKYKGKYVNTGVYYYVIQAEGSEGKKYKEGGAINILRSR